MNMNPLIVERMAEYERDRIRQDMKQIRLEEEALRAGRKEEKITKARINLSRLLIPIVCMLARLRTLRVRLQKTVSYSGIIGACRG